MRPRKCVQGLGIERAPALSLPKADVQLCSARERESWGASERPDAVTARLPSAVRAARTHETLGHDEPNGYTNHLNP